MAEEQGTSTRGKREGDDWRNSWGEFRNRPLPYGVGTEFAIAEHQMQGGVRSTKRTTCTLNTISLEDGVFQCRSGDGPITTRVFPLHPRLVGRVYGYGEAATMYPLPGPLVRTVVPAGSFRCARTTRHRQLGDGTILRVDEWWAPQVPFPVQRWERPEADVDRLYAPPKSVAALPEGCIWAVLERIERR